MNKIQEERNYKILPIKESYTQGEVWEAFAYGTLANEVVYSLSLINRGKNLRDEEKNALLVAENLLERIIWLEQNKNRPIGARNKLKLLNDAFAFLESWINCGIDFPQNDQGYLQRLKMYSDCLREGTNTEKISDQKVLGDLEKIFGYMGEINLHKVHYSSCR